MSEEKKSIEVSGETIETAIEEGLKNLAVDRSEVSIKVLDEGRKGFLGLGNRGAVVRLTMRTPHIEESPPLDDIEETIDELDMLPDPELLEEEETACETTKTLLQHMGIEATVETSLTAPDENGSQVVLIRIEGEDSQLLVGHQGETMVTLQFILRLMVSQQLHRRVEFVVDVDGYRQKREEGLTRLAERMASKALKRNKPVTLEPMPPYERRLIHIALRDHQTVDTRSIGAGENRRVRISPKS